MNRVAILLLAVAEVAALAIIARLWIRRRHHFVTRLLWSLILLVPLFGLLMYGFIVSDLEPNPERTDTQSDSNADATGFDEGPH